MLAPVRLPDCLFDKLWHVTDRGSLIFLPQHQASRLHPAAEAIDGRQGLREGLVGLFLRSSKGWVGFLVGWLVSLRRMR